MEDLEDKKQQDFVNKIKSYEQALKEAAKSVDSTSALKILNLLEDYCNSSQAGCGCGCD
jgi:hypothetical protein